MTPTPLMAAALVTLDTAKEEHWTSDGQARVDVVNAALIGFDAEPVGRQDIVNEAPLFMRETAADLIREYRALASPLDRNFHTEATGDNASLPPRAAEKAPTLRTLGKELKAPVDASVEMKGLALDVPTEQLMQSVPMLEAALKELNEKSDNLHKQRNAIDDELKALYIKSDLCGMQLKRIKPKDDPNDGVRAYLRASKEARKERAERAKAFLGNGTNAKDVAEQLRAGSKLDDALQRRKAALGSTRPAVRVPAGIQE